MEKVAPALGDKGGLTPGRVAALRTKGRKRNAAGGKKDFESVGEIVRRIVARLRKRN